MIDHYRRKRREGPQVHPDLAGDEGWDAVVPARLPAAEAAFHCAWVRQILAEALTRVRAQCLKRKQQLHLDLFEARYLTDGDFPPSWEELGARYGIDQKTARARTDTVARHFRLVLRRMVRGEISMPFDSRHGSDAALDEEIRALLSPLGD